MVHDPPSNSQCYEALRTEGLTHQLLWKRAQGKAILRLSLCLTAIIRGPCGPHFFKGTTVPWTRQWVMSSTMLSHAIPLWYVYIYIYYWLVVEPSEKWWSSSVGMIFPFPKQMESHNPFHGPNHQPDICLCSFRLCSTPGGSEIGRSEISCAFPRRGLQLSTIELKAGPLSNQRMHAVLHLQTTRPGHLKQQNEGFTLLYRHSIEPSYRI